MSHPTVLLLCGVLVLLGGVVRGYSGFGASMVWVASLSLAYPPALVVPAVLILEVLASVLLARSAWRDVEWRSVRWLLASTLLLTPLGVLLLEVVPERPMRLAVGAAIVIGTLALALGKRRNGAPSRRASVLAGSVSGVVNGATGIGGPPATILYFAGDDVHVGRSTLIMYFLATDATAVMVMAVRGLVDVSVVRMAAVLMPLALGGAWLGKLLYQRIGVRGFRPFVLTVLGVLGLATLARAVLVG